MAVLKRLQRKPMVGIACFCILSLVTFNNGLFGTDRVVRLETATEPTVALENITVASTTSRKVSLPDGMYASTVSLKGLVFDDNTPIAETFPLEFSVNITTSVVSQ